MVSQGPSIMTRIHHQPEYFHCPENSLCSTYSYYPHLQLLATTDLFPVHSFAFPECHVVGIIQYVAFSGWFLSLSSMHLSFLHVFQWLDSSFTLLLNNILLSGCTTVCLPIHLLKEIFVVSKFWQI